MATPRRLAVAAGVCYLVTHVTSIAALALYGPVLTDPGWITGAGPDTPILLGALLEVLLAIAIIGTACTLFPVVSRHGRASAAGYLGLRTLEAAVITVGVVSLLAVTTLRRQPPAGADDGALRTVGRALVAVHDWTFLLGPDFVLGANTFVLAWILYRSRLVPRFIAVLGMVGGPLVFASAVAVLFGCYGQLSVWGALSAVPVFAWELALAFRLIVRGFSTPADPGVAPAPDDADAAAAVPAG
ncbi:hypothetical protein GCM10010441_73370 [Kitasatospora paracochleata]|uniref:DUF4386 domain-containing protein n=1 Tax=Kitasatospora paracochleata TaxID=58354 RepID=A0ABT1J5S7_9ACTN|nr:DUF4386 domain-containing protein [Kitasatospora paracochleata]MCP2312738.1 hypothetical protein [Kitasatospora paracochleata]